MRNNKRAGEHIKCPFQNNPDVYYGSGDTSLAAFIFLYDPVGAIQEDNPEVF